MDYTISLQTLFWLAAGIASLYALYKIFTKPINQLNDHEQRIHVIESTLDERKSTDKLILKGLSAMMNHMIDGSGIDKLKETRDELQEGIIEHHN